ncbi:MAG: cobalamin B12-binding domain-containing protein, partial [Pseudomonadota bacterium]
MAKVLLLSPPYVPGYMRNARCDFVSLSNTQWYPIWLGFAGGWLEQQGHKVKLLDAPAAKLSPNDVEKEAREFRPDVIAVYSSTQSRESDGVLADRLLSVLGCKGIWIGPYVSVAPESYLKASHRISLAIDGEFEFPLAEWVSGQPAKEIRNMVIKDDDAFFKTEKRDYLTTKELDAIPFVSEFFSRHLDFSHYRTVSEPFPFMDTMTGR